MRRYISPRVVKRKPRRRLRRSNRRRARSPSSWSLIFATYRRSRSLPQSSSRMRRSCTSSTTTRARLVFTSSRSPYSLTRSSGVMRPPLNLLTADGYDLQWGTNVVGHWYFTELLMPALIAGAASSPDHHARVVTLSSSGAYAETLHFDAFRDGPARRKLGDEQLYYQSKHVRSPFFVFRIRIWAVLMVLVWLVPTGERRRGAAGGEAVRRQGHHLAFPQPRCVITIIIGRSEAGRSHAHMDAQGTSAQSCSATSRLQCGG